MAERYLPGEDLLYGGIAPMIVVAEHLEDKHSEAMDRIRRHHIGRHLYAVEDTRDDTSPRGFCVDTAQSFARHFPRIKSAPAPRVKFFAVSKFHHGKARKLSTPGLMIPQRG